MVDKCLVALLEECICSSHGVEVSKVFKSRFHKWNGFDHLRNVPVTVQVLIMNKFWNHLLIPLESTTDIRVWLQRHDSLSFYIDEFSNQWGKSAVEQGLL